MHEMLMELQGNFFGHAAPAAMLAFSGLWWFWFVVNDLRGGRRPPGSTGPVTRGWPVRTTYSRSETWFKLTFPVAGGLGELWWASWLLTDSSLVNYQHATMYFGFFLAGVTDLLVRSGRVPAYVAHLALAGAFANAGFQLLSHAHGLPVSDAVHAVVAWLLVMEAAVIVAELYRPHRALSLARAYGVVLLAAWFFHLGWILYGSGWDLSDPYNVMRVHLFFTWDVVAVLLAMVLLYRLFARLMPAVGGASEPGESERAALHAAALG